MENKHLQFLGDAKITGYTDPFPRVVQTGFFVWKVNKVDCKAQNFTVRMTAHWSWTEKDPFNVIKPTKGDAWSLQDFTWQPQIAFPNLLVCANKQEWTSLSLLSSETGEARACSKDDWASLLRAQGGGSTYTAQATHSVDGLFTFAAPVDIHDLPFDVQYLNVEVSSALDTDYVYIISDGKSRVSREAGSALGEWHVCPEPRCVDPRGWAPGLPSLLTDPGDSSRGKQYSRSHLTIIVVRKPGYFIWNVFALILVLGTAALCSLSLDVRGGRLTLNFVVILSMVTFKLFLANQLPDVGYNTLLDKYALSCMLLVFGMAILGTLMLSVIDDEDIYEQADGVFFWICLSYWGLANLYFYYQMMRASGRRRTIMTEHGSFEEKNTRHYEFGEQDIAMVKTAVENALKQQ